MHSPATLPPGIPSPEKPAKANSETGKILLGENTRSPG
jgi:hypothetical protein